MLTGLPYSLFYSTFFLENDNRDGENKNDDSKGKILQINMKWNTIEKTKQDTKSHCNNNNNNNKQTDKQQYTHDVWGR